MTHVIDTSSNELVFTLTEDEMSDLVSLRPQALLSLNKFVENFISNAVSEQRQNIIEKITGKLNKASLEDLQTVKDIVDK